MNVLNKKNTWLKYVVIGIVVLIIATTLIVFFASGSIDKINSYIQCEKAEKYLDELDYENAIARYEAAILINPNNVEAYLGLANIYMEMEDYDSAKNVVKDGLKENPGNYKLSEKKSEVKELLEENEVSEENTTDTEQTAEEQHRWVMKTMIYYDQDGNKVCYYVYEYDANGNETNCTYFNPNDGTSNVMAEVSDPDCGIVIHSVYNADGNVEHVEYDSGIIKTCEYNSDGTISNCELDDANGNVLKKFYYGPDGLVYYYVYEYNADGNVTKHVRYGNDSLVSEYTEYIYDADGNEIKEVTYEADGLISNYTEYEYDTYGNEIRSILRYLQEGKSYVYSISEYDNKGNEIIRTDYYADGSVRGYNSYEYDANGNMTLHTEYNADGSIDECYEYTYDENGNRLTGKIYDPVHNWVRYYWEGQYDEYGNIVSFSGESDEGGFNGTYEYVYDLNGNILKETYKYSYDGTVETEYVLA